jgi:phage baseplate assembly protein gpV
MKMRWGTIKEFDDQKYLAKVFFEENNLVSGWLQILTRGSQDIKDEFPVDIGAMAYCITDDFMERGVILGTAFNEKDQVASGGKDIRCLTYKDGTVQVYDQNLHKLRYVLENTELTMSRDGFALKRSTESLNSILSDLIDAIKLLTVTTPVGPSGVPINVATFTAIKERLPNLFIE